MQADVPQIGVTASRCCCTHVGLVKLYDITVAVPGSVFPVPQRFKFQLGVCEHGLDLACRSA